jgi:GNAT superfamily N-acetyltransferase
MEIRPLQARDVPAAAEIEVQPYDARHEDALLAAFDEALRDGGSFPRRPPASLEDLRSVWIDDKAATAVATLDGEFAGFYYVQPNFPGRAGDIANAGYLVPSAMRGRGVGRALLEHSLETARGLGFRAMMFNLVFERNPARRLWEAAGFEVIGRIPGAIDREQDALIYWREL